MTELSVDPEAVRAFATTQHGVAGDIAAAGNLDTVANVAAMTPVFGLIGADYLAMFAVAELLHGKDVNALSARYAHLGQVAAGTATAIQTTDGEFAGGLDRMDTAIGGQG
ncbi:ESX-1 secretion-associated protein [Nocardia otitidiscaviarum]|uniref:ESX-1 secretion-associated protein n=1 Tax=Nocardia otitidiscaviarum TaxID=1823 RepID=A0A378YW95_9NOCA|nr:type VII secretion target [Nocardia otitidiscaviarum]MBF6135325.1 ESX-1 secretion-associated protein [Nocardia otitidiscaviarum]MBF6181043.1 ESX-1 secretion-associated protein [Nocardia otitidiscaviarum]MBF6237295.1 ESX-1 secretion-associated protein [Nocardia otitidiscaviarum]MBF6487146.1 ESX-1 secretion-associated protein [Nocardia otitidiscaviarum]MCP9624508.1 ESX-1 secretion-associated protein [Nocardia otitidiscaviarum]